MIDVLAEMNAATKANDHISARLAALGLPELQVSVAKQVCQGASAHAGCFIAASDDKPTAMKAMQIIFEELATMAVDAQV